MDPPTPCINPTPKLQYNWSPNSYNTTTLHHITSHHFGSHHIGSHHITSHHIASHRIASHRIASHRIPSHRIESHRIASHHITSHHITSHPIISHHIKSHYGAHVKAELLYLSVQQRVQGHQRVGVGGCQVTTGADIEEEQLQTRGRRGGSREEASIKNRLLLHVSFLLPKTYSALCIKCMHSRMPRKLPVCQPTCQPACPPACHSSIHPHLLPRYQHWRPHELAMPIAVQCHICIPPRLHAHR